LAFLFPASENLTSGPSLVQSGSDALARAVRIVHLSERSGVIFPDSEAAHSSRIDQIVHSSNLPSAHYRHIQLKIELDCINGRRFITLYTAAPGFPVVAEKDHIK